MYGSVPNEGVVDRDTENNSIVEEQAANDYSDFYSTSTFGPKSFGFFFIIFLIATTTVFLLSSQNYSSNDTAIDFKFIDPKDAIAFFEKIEKLERPNFSALTEMELRLLYSGFSSTFRKGEEDDLSGKIQTRFEIFKKNLISIEKLNEDEKKAGGSAVFGLNLFADVDQDEFSTRFGLKSMRSQSKKEEVALKQHESFFTVQSSKRKADWTGIYTTPIVDQGICGCCWAVSTVEQVESDAIRLGLLDRHEPLSFQQLLSCDENCYGCGGGFTQEAVVYVADNGLVPAKKYPFVDHNHNNMTSECLAFDPLDTVISITDSTYLYTETEMIDHVLEVGPLSVGLDATIWQFYTGGILNLCGAFPNHAVQVVGVNLDEGYWKIRNSWTDKWGEAGHIRLKLGFDTCEITDSPMFTSPVRVRHAAVNVNIISASNLVRKDLLEASDPYVVLELGKQNYKSKTVENSDSPVWNEDITLNWDGAAILKVSVFDEDKLMKDEPLGTMEFSLTKESFPDYHTVEIRGKLQGATQGQLNLDITLKPIFKS